MKNIKTLYKKDTEGNIRILNMWTDNGTLVQESGLIDGKLTQTLSLCHPKNTGKSNETTAEQQAVLELESKHKKKLREGYCETLQLLEQSVTILPMLAKVYSEEAHKIDWRNVYVQPKLDAQRAIGNGHKFTSRGGKTIETLSHISKEFPKYLTDVFDGEMYAHGFTFQENMSMIKKYKEGFTENLKWHVYDMISDLGFIHRHTMLKNFLIGVPNVEIVPTYKVNNLEEVQSYHEKFVEDGYEGTMIRWGNEGYKINGRSSNLLKYKNHFDIAAELIDVIPYPANPLLGMAVCLFEGKEFKATFKATHEKCAEYLRDKEKFIGETCEIRFIKYTDGGIPSHGNCLGFRNDK